MEQKNWLLHYPSGVRKEIPFEEYNHTIVSLLETSFSKYSKSVALINMRSHLTFQQVDEYSKNFANYLLNETTLNKGDKVAIQMPNLLQYPIAVAGVLRAGMVVVNVNPLYTPREMEHQLKDSGAKAIVIIDLFAKKLEDVQQKTNIEHVLITQTGDMMGNIKGTLVNFALKYIKRIVPRYDILSSISFKRALEKGACYPYKAAKVQPDDIAFLQYTGGTTGVSKGAILTHGNVIANITQVIEWLKPVSLQPKDYVITTLPIYHIFSLITVLAFFQIGGCNILITNPRDVKGLIKILSRYPFVAFQGINTLFNALLNQKKFTEVNFSNCRIVLGGGMATQEHIIKKWFEKTKTWITEAYGLTEASPAVAINPIGENYVNTVGVQLPNTLVKVVDQQGNDLGYGEAGELWVKGPQVMQGYWNKPEETKLVLTNDNWLKTGDIAVINENGLIKIVDRKKEMINVSGFNVYPNEIEEVVSEYPGVIEVAAVGIPDQSSGEVVKIFVVCSDKTITEEHLINYCRTKLTRYKIPKKVEFRDSLPKSNVGKILRRELREV